MDIYNGLGISNLVTKVIEVFSQLLNFRVITAQYLPMVKPVVEKPLLWRVMISYLNSQMEIHLIRLESLRLQLIVKMLELHKGVFLNYISN